MRTLSVSAVARNFHEVLASVEYGQEEIVLMRNAKRVARLVPEARGQNALEVFGGLRGTLDTAAVALSKRRKSPRGRVSELRNPWAR